MLNMLREVVEAMGMRVTDTYTFEANGKERYVISYNYRETSGLNSGHSLTFDDVVTKEEAAIKIASKVIASLNHSMNVQKEYYKRR